MPLPAAPGQGLSPAGHEGLALLPTVGELCTGAALGARLLRLPSIFLPCLPFIHMYSLSGLLLVSQALPPIHLLNL